MIGSFYDVIISGAGPAGSTLAYNLARSGMEVLVLEKEFMPRNKPCGGAVSRKAAGLLDLPWQEVVEDVVHTVTFNFMGRSGITVRTTHPVSYMVTRSVFDRILAEHAKTAGAYVIENRAVKDVFSDNDRVSVSAGGETFQGKIFIGADGAKGVAARLLGLHRPGGTGPTLEAEIECPPEIMASRQGIVELDCGAIPWGYGWVFPKKGHLSTGLAVFTSSVRNTHIKQHFNNLLDREGLNSGKTLIMRGHPIPIDGGQKKRIHCKFGLLIGDAAGLVDPFSGEGIYYAIKSAHLAAEAILDNKKSLWRAPECYQKLVARHISGELGMARQMAKIFFGFPKLIFGIIEKHTGIAEELCRIACGDKSYGELKGLGTRLLNYFPSIIQD